MQRPGMVDSVQTHVGLQKHSPHLTDEHDAFRNTVRRFVAREIAPHVNSWDEAGAFPRELYGKAGSVGILGVGFPEELGGVPADTFFKIIVGEERPVVSTTQASAGSARW